MVNLKITLKEEGKVVEIHEPRDLFIDFRLGTIIVNFYDEMGPRTGSYSFSDISDIDWDTVQGTPEQQVVLSTYQQRAIRNLPPKLPGQPDYTYDPRMPKVASPTPIQEVNEEVVETGSTKNTNKDMGVDQLNRPTETDDKRAAVI